MSTKRFHITPDGPKRCKVKTGTCRYSSQHFSSEESALTAISIQKQKDSKKEKIRNLEQGLTRFNDESFFMRSSFSLDQDTRTPRHFAEELESRVKAQGKAPELHHAAGSWRLRNGATMPIHVSVKRGALVDKEAEAYVGLWTVTTKMTNYSRTEDVVSQDITFKFDDERSSKRSLIQAHETFRNALIMSGLREDEEVLEKKADEMVESFTAMVNAIETESQGEDNLWKKGMGYFTKSDPFTIRVDESFSNSAFTGRNFSNFLKSNYMYESRTPEAEIRITDRDKKTGSQWSIQRKNNQWSIEIIDKDGNKTESLCPTSKDIHAHVYYAALDHINPDDKRQSHRKAEYARDLMDKIEEALEENKERASDTWNKERIINEERRARILSAAKNNEPKNSILNKIFDSFK